MKRITLLTYIMTTANTRPATSSTAISPPKSAGSIVGNPKPPSPGSSKCRDSPVCLGKLKLLGTLHPLEPISPASNPTSASRVHCQKRNGCTSCRLVCWKASVIVSTAEIGKLHLGGNASAERYCEPTCGANQFWKETTSVALRAAWVPKGPLTIARQFHWREMRM